MKDPTGYAPFLWLFTALLVFRVAGQIIVVLFSAAMAAANASVAVGAPSVSGTSRGAGVRPRPDVCDLGGLQSSIGLLRAATRSCRRCRCLVQRGIRERHGLPLHQPHDAPARPALVGRDDSNHLSHLRRSVPVDVRAVSTLNNGGDRPGSLHSVASQVAKCRQNFPRARSSTADIAPKTQLETRHTLRHGSCLN